jgi:hypothetical protein
MTGPDPSGSPPHIRRQPSTSSAAPTGGLADDARTHIIRRAPLSAEPATTLIAGASDVDRSDIPSGTTAIGASVASIVGGWATGVVATDLVTGWWASDRVFSLAVGFLALLFGVTTVCGVILLLLRRSVGPWLLVFGSAVALLTFGSVFLAGARVARAVYIVPVLPLASLLLAVHPATRRWCRSV